MFFESCKIIINNYTEYLLVMNHMSDILHGYSGLNSDVTKQYPLYLMITDPNTIKYTYNKSEYNRSKFNVVAPKDIEHMKYIISHHFSERFKERFDTVSHTRFKKIVSNMLKRGTWLKRKDSFQLMKYKKTSDYVLFSQFENNEKVHYLIVLTTGNILTTIYEFNIKDLKFFKESYGRIFRI